MNLDRLGMLLAAPMASLFLVLSLCAFVLQRPVSVGMHVPITRVRISSTDECHGVDRQIVALLHKDGSTWLNEEHMRPDELHSELGDIFKNLKYKYILMFADSDVSFGQFASFYDLVASSSTGLTVELRTRQLQSQLNECPLGSSCGLEWPDHTYFPCVAQQILLVPYKSPFSRLIHQSQKAHRANENY